jgi:hypothetical protein
LAGVPEVSAINPGKPALASLSSPLGTDKKYFYIVNG